VYKSKLFVELANSLAARLKVKSAILDGEIVCLAGDGKPVFNDLMFRRHPPCYCAFDLLWLDGKDFRQRPLLERKARLRRILPAESSDLLYVDHIAGRGVELFRSVCQRDLEGIVGKWSKGRYAPDEPTTWVKVKNPAYSQAEGRHELFRPKGRTKSVARQAVR
jgi:bifunctional non-homologous end joining protein LigD